MARPRVFVSSTYYDLKHIRASLDLFIDSLGYESVLSEKGDIAYAHDRPLDDSCYREASSADIFVLIVGGRYGSEASSENKKPDHLFYERYESITKKEYESAVERDIPTYILIEAGVYSEYRTFLRNKDNTSINYAHVDSVNVFHLIEEILARRRNNPVQPFEKFADIQSWLRDQWAGMFRDFLNRKSQQQQLATLTSQVAELKAINETLKKYLEKVMTSVSPDDSPGLIASEEKRLEEAKRNEKIRENDWYKEVGIFLNEEQLPFDSFVEAMKKAKTVYEFVDDIVDKAGLERPPTDLIRDQDQPPSDWEMVHGYLFQDFYSGRSGFNEIRALLGVPPISDQKVSKDKSGRTQRSTQTRSKRSTA